MANLNPVLFVFTLILFLNATKAANILFVSVTPSKSHQSVFQPIWKELSLRGHKVTAITPSPLKDEKLTNLTEIDLSSLFEGIKRASTEGAFLWNFLMKKPSFPVVFIKDSIMTYIWSGLGVKAFEHENMQKFLNEEHQFDVAIIEWLYPTMAAFGAKYNCPIIGVTSLGAPVVAMDTIGNPSHPIIAPDHNLPVTRDMPFRERLMSALYAVYVRIYYHLAVLPREDKIARKYLGEDLPYLGDIERSISLLLLNRNPVFHRPIPMVPSVIEIGTMKLNRTKAPLDKDLKNFLDKSKQGAIYFSLGSAVRVANLQEHILEAIIKTFKNLPYNVIMKWEGSEFPNKPDNVFTREWLPQESILDHPNLKLFITQGGLQSSEEAITHKVPIIGIPFQSDQTANIDTLVKYGMGKMIDMDDITYETLSEAIVEIMKDPRYGENALRLSKLIYDKPINGLERAVWWVEYVIRHKGAKHLRSPLLDIPWVQYLMLDVLAFIAAVIGLIILVFYGCFKGILALCRSKKDKKVKSKRE